MSKQETTPNQNSKITTEPFVASQKIFVPGSLHNIQVAMREITLTDSPSAFKNGSFDKTLKTKLLPYMIPAGPTQIPWLWLM